jgi:hypothetical protein
MLFFSSQSLITLCPLQSAGNKSSSNRKTFSLSRIFGIRLYTAAEILRRLLVCKRRLLRKIKERSRWCHNLRGDSFYFVAARTQHLHLRAPCISSSFPTTREQIRARCWAQITQEFIQKSVRDWSWSSGGKRLI